MNIKTKTSLVGFLLALANLNTPSTAKTIGEISQTTTKPSLEQRLKNLNVAIRKREGLLTESSQNQNNFTIFRAKSWRNSWGDGGG